MFCKHCGTKNLEGSLYCINDGQALSIIKDGVQVRRNQVSFCPSCSHELDKNSLYCSKCGVAQETVIENNVAATLDTSLASLGKLKGSVPTKIPTVTSFQDFFSMSTISHSAKFSSIAVGVLFLLSLFVSTIINRTFRGLLADEFFGEAAGLISKLKVVSVTDIMMLGHLTGVKYSAQLLILEGNLITKGGLFLFAVIPAIALLTAGFLANRNSVEKSAIERIYTAIPIAIIYAIMIGFVGLFAGISMNVPDPTGWFGAITVKADYQFFTVLINSFILGLIFVTLGSLLGLTKEMKGQGGNKGYGISIYRALLHSIVGIVICIVIAYGVIGLNEEYKRADMPGTASAMLVSQVGGYFWNLAHFNTLSFEVGTRWEYVQAQYSILGGGKATDDEEGFRDALKEIVGNLWYLFLVPILLHIWAGNEIRKAVSQNILFEIGAYAVVFGLINALVFSISKFSLETNLDGSILVSFGFPFFTTFLFGTIFAFVVAYIGVIITNKNTQKANS